PTHHFGMRFTSTPRGARLARRLTSHRLDEWGFPYGTDPNDTVTLIAAELTANAVRHARIPDRGFRLDLTASPPRSASKSHTRAVRPQCLVGRVSRAAPGRVA
ncbi:ATP-binding protein, partial [Streptomyces beijiangensis]|uniref:ATP-binding protein n=2 Tax=Streptomyces beijiangensis TaxID=163361 RepID=UPI001F5D14C0